MTTARAVAHAVTLLVLVACHPTAGEREIVRRWLLCEECNQGELGAVVPLGDRVTGMLAKALLHGPSASNRQHIRRQAQELFDRLPPPTVVAKVHYIDHYDSNYVATYQAHAAIALGRIGTPAARAALFQALQRDSTYRDDIIRELADAAPIALDTAAGASQGAPRDSLVRTTPAVRIRDSISGQTLANIPVRFTVDSGGGHVADSVRRTGANGVASMPWTLGPGPDSFNLLRAEAFRRSLRFHATSHGFTPRLVFTVQPVNGSPGQPLLPGVEVTVVDAWDQRDTTYNGTAQAVIMGTTVSATAPVVAGVVNFSNLVPIAIGPGFRIRVLAAGVTPAVSQPFAVVP